MAHFKKLTKTQASGLANHCARRIHSSKSFIDFENTKNNEFREISIEHFLEKNEIHVMQRGDIKIASSLVVTLPKDVKEDDESRFFLSVLKFMEKDTKIKCETDLSTIVGYYIHRDETTPHIHILTVPVVPDHKKGGLKCCMKEWLTKEYLTNFHERLSNALERDLGYHVSILSNEREKAVNRPKNVSIQAFREQKQYELEQTQLQIAQNYERLEKLKDAEDYYKRRVSAIKNAYENERGYER